MDWTHKGLKITDIRKLKQLVAISVDNKEIEGSILINSDIFDERLSSYFLGSARNVSRHDIMSVEWNMYATKGYYVKQNLMSGDELQKFEQNQDRWYVSFLEIAGPLGTFDTILSKSPKN